MLGNRGIQELIAYAVFPDPEVIQKTFEKYESNQGKIMGYSLDDEIIGILGYESLPDEVVKIAHISVHPEFRGLGYGRGMILELIDLIRPRKIVAETDEEAVDFYRNIGFVIVSLGEKYPNVERFECSFETEFN
ncbi:GNAT family N-acetyltransferase [Cohnella sp. CFH 77786]|nr:GNAT family N-acetyltransferase [Cohnella sp. CFH 77786]